MKKFLVLALTLATVFGMVVPTGALSAGETIYLVPDSDSLGAVEAYFFGVEAEDSQIVPMDLRSDGVFYTTIPANATQVLFVSQDDSYTVLNGGAEPLADLAGNTYDMNTKSWRDISGGTAESVSVNEESGGSNQTTNTINVSGKLGESGVAEDVVSVNVSWGKMEFTYTPEYIGSWDSESHSYVGGYPASWTSDSNAITVLNHSNVDVTADFSFESAAALGIRGEFHDAGGTVSSSMSLASADNGQGGGGAGAATSGTVTFHITDGSISQTTDSLGTITVVISKD